MRSLRARTVLLTAAVLTGLLVAVGAALVLALQYSLTDSAVEAGRLRAEELAVLAAEVRLPAPLPTSDDDVLVQVLAADGTVLATSGTTVALTVPLPAPGTEAVRAVEEVPGASSGPYRVVLVGVQTPGGPAAVAVAVSLEDVRDTVRTTLGLLAVAVPVLVLLLSAGTWVLVGRTLHPVAVMTEQAAGIGAAELARRLPVPARDDELGRLAGTLNAMLARIETSVLRQKRFVADAAHELRSPVATLRTQLETARPDDPGLLEDLLAETVRLQQLADQLLLLARLDGPTLRRAPVDLDDVVDRSLARQAKQAGVRVDATGVQPVQVTGAADVLERVVANLLSNAVRHAATTVVVTTRALDPGGELVVQDDGAGIAGADRERVFEAFTRLDEARARDSGGAGLGLAVVREAVAAHGGTVRVETSPLGGALLRVLLPAPPGGARSSEQHRHGVDDEPGQRPDDRAVDPDELQVTADSRLDAG